MKHFVDKNLINIPEALKQIHQWVARDEKKIPYQPNGNHARSNDRSTWSTYREVVDACKQHPNRFAGIGFVLSEDDHFLGLDLDGCIIDGQIVPEAQEIIDQCDSYTEVSPSGQGIRIIGTGKISAGIKNKYDMSGHGFKALEIYETGRYLTMTGDVDGEPREIKSIDLNRLTLPAEKSGTTSSHRVPINQKSHEPLLNRIRSDKDGVKFTMLYDHGSLVDYEGDQSRADMALVTILAKWTNFDPMLLDQLFRGSTLMRAKWDKVHHSDGATYGEMTIRRVLQDRPIFHKNEIEGFLRFHYDFRFNEVLGRVETRSRSENKWQVMEDYQFNSIYRHIHNQGGQIGQQTLHGLLQSDFTTKYDPFVDYFTGLPQWDGKTDYIARLASKVKTTNQLYWEFCLRKWLVALVASAIDPKTVPHQVLLLRSEQGRGKSTFFTNLMPEPLKDYMYSGVLNPVDKDTLIHLAECLIINLDEMETLTKHKEGALKEIITKSEIRIRRAYGRFSSNLTRRASMCGSVNHTNILHDKTGSRRFLIHEVESIDYQNMGNMDLVYAQAYSLYQSGFRFWFDTEDNKKVQEHNSRFEVQTVEEDLLLEHFERAEPNQPEAERLRATQILAHMHGGDLPTGANSASIRLGQALNKHGYHSSKKKGDKYWWVIKSNPAFKRKSRLFTN